MRIGSATKCAAVSAPLAESLNSTLYRAVVEEPSADQQSFRYHLNTMTTPYWPECARPTLLKMVWAIDGRASVMAGCSSDEHAWAMLIPLANCRDANESRRLVGGGGGFAAM
jgi:hypothetical protein